MHKIIKTLGIIAILVLLTGTVQASDWPMFHHDARHTGYTDESIADDLELLWSYETGNCVDSSPAVADGKVFVGSHDSR
jgi:outer membrane protein assembly factor BamB